MSIQVENVSKKYGSQKALDKIGFKLESGEIVGFLGPNGAGKSTMMKIITTYIDQDTGKVLVNGFDNQKQSLDVKSSVGYLPEHNPLYLDLYVKEYLGFHADIHNIGIKRIEEVIEQVGLKDIHGKKISQLSKGYRQRVGLAAALLHDPEVLILDEPTTGLDPNQLLDIRELIKEIGIKKTVLLSTHIMQEVEAMCDRVIIINEGRIVADQKLENLLSGQKQVILVEFDLRVEEQLLKKIPDVDHVVNEGGNHWTLVFNTDDDRRPHVFDFAKSNGFKSLMLNRKVMNLETLFHELTN
jgi:ABC-2 type transport system ATP-binding protein